MKARRREVAGSRLEITYGAGALPLAVQLKQQGFKVGRGWTSAWQKDADEIARLYVRGVLTEPMADRCRERLQQAIYDVVMD